MSKPGGLKLRGRVAAVLFQNRETGYAVLAMDLPSKQEKALQGRAGMIAVGPLCFLRLGDEVLLEGNLQEHAKYGEQFLVSRILESASSTPAPGNLSLEMGRTAPQTEEEIFHFLLSGRFKGIGKKTAARLLKEWGTETLAKIQEDPQEAARVGKRSFRIMEDAARLLKEEADDLALPIFLSPFHPRPYQVQKIRSDLGPLALEQLQENPYLLLRQNYGFRFEAVDDFACQQNLVQDLASIRLRAFFFECLKNHLKQRDLCVQKERLLKEAEERFKQREQKRREEMDVSEELDFHRVREGLEKVALRFPQLLWKSEIYIYHPLYFAMESETVLRLNKRRAGKKEEVDPLLLHRMEEEAGFLLNEEQRAAVKMALEHRLSLLTGGPGTGKTTLLKILCRYLEEQGAQILLAAPTGRAAKRMAEQTGRPAKTIHRLLEVQAMVSDGDWQEAHFSRDADHPLEGDFLIVDESSMLDLPLFSSLLEAVPDSMKILLIGDPEQLPPVGLGDVLQDLIRSDCFPITRLQHILRQKEGSLIVKNATRILRGESPQFDQSLRSDCLQVLSEGDEQTVERLLTFYFEVLPREYGMSGDEGVQVYAPFHRGVAGVQSMNRRFQERRPKSPDCPYIDWPQGRFYEGDRVMQVKNNYHLELVDLLSQEKEAGVFNGDCGHVLKINLQTEEVQVQFEDGRMATYDRKAGLDLQLAYCMTIHKAQGSEREVVILVLPKLYTGMENRSLLYTGLTRGRKKVFVFTSPRVLPRYLQKRKGGQGFSLFSERLRGEVK